MDLHQVQCSKGMVYRVEEAVRLAIIMLVLCTMVLFNNNSHHNNLSLITEHHMEELTIHTIINQDNNNLQDINNIPNIIHIRETIVVIQITEEDILTITAWRHHLAARLTDRLAAMNGTILSRDKHLLNLLQILHDRLMEHPLQSQLKDSMM